VKKVNIKDQFAQPFAFRVYDISVIRVNLERELFYPLQTTSAKYWCR